MTALHSPRSVEERGEESDHVAPAELYPTSHVRVPRSSTPKPRDSSRRLKYLTEDEVQRLLSIIEGKRDRILFLLAYRHGLRASEVGLLRVDDLDFKKLRIKIQRLKGSHSGEHPLQSDEVRALKAHLRSRPVDSPVLFTSRLNQPISRKTLEWLTKRYGEKASLPQEFRHFHLLRHSIAKHMLDAGTRDRFVQDWLGHANIQNTRMYKR